MSRTVSGTLAAAQIANNRTPYVHMVFTSYDTLTTYDLSYDSATFGNRVLLIDHNEESYNDYAVLVLKNYPKTLPTNLKGYSVDIGYGDTTGAGNEYADTPRLWVKHQQFVSAGGKELCILELEGMWAKLKETLLRIGTPPYYIAGIGDFGAATTPYDIISYILANEVDPAMTLNALAEDDGIIDTYTPEFQVNGQQPFEYVGQVIYRLMKMTYSFLRPKAALAWEVKYPQNTDTVNFTYHSSSSPKYIGWTERKNLLIPNRIFVFSNAGTDGLWTNIITSQADDTVSQGEYGVVPYVELAPEITTQGNSDNRAQAILKRRVAEVIGGRLIINHDCRMELLDRVAVEDTRGA